MYVACWTLEIYLPSISDSEMKECDYLIQFLNRYDYGFLHKYPFNSVMLLNVIFITWLSSLFLVSYKIGKR